MFHFFFTDIHQLIITEGIQWLQTSWLPNIVIRH